MLLRDWIASGFFSRLLLTFLCMCMQIAWASGKGTNGKDMKEFWDVDVGASYIPWEKLGTAPYLLDTLTEGNCIDTSTLPPG